MLAIPLALLVVAVLISATAYRGAGAIPGNPIDVAFSHQRDRFRDAAIVAALAVAAVWVVMFKMPDRAWQEDVYAGIVAVSALGLCGAFLYEMRRARRQLGMYYDASLAEINRRLFSDPDGDRALRLRS
jgi:hypothetical protein